MKFHFLSLIILGLIFTTHVQAKDAEKVMHQGTDISAAVRFFSDQVRTLNTPIVVYNWSPAGDQPFWAKDRTDEESADAVRYSARSFWGNYGSPKGDDNMYGYGLYAAADPVATVSYGQSKWLLLQMTFPIGMKIIDLPQLYYNSSAFHPDREATYKIMTNFECSGVVIDSFFVNGGKRLTPKCQGLVQRIFDDELQVQAFAYGYSQTNFQDCSDGQSQTPRAFVLMRGDWIQPGLVRHFTERSTAHIEDRTLIQTLFLDGSQDQNEFSTSAALQDLKDFLMSHLDYAVDSSKTVCAGAYCTIQVRLCNEGKDCQTISLKPILRRGGSAITAAAAAKTSHGSLLWKDLEGTAKTETKTEWLKKNKFACTGKLPYDIPAAKGSQ